MLERIISGNSQSWIWNNADIVCEDGTTLSVQASQFHCCIPKEDARPTISYSHVEVGYPSSTPPDSWAEHIQNETESPDIYAYMPVQMVRDYVKEHGGEVCTQATS